MQVNGPSHVHNSQAISGPHNARAAQPQPTSTTAAPSDELQISDAARLIDSARELPDIRQDRVAEIRSAIANGTYETQERLGGAVEQLLNELA